MAERIAVIGAGAIGGYFGVALHEAGHDVTLVDGWAEHVEYVRARGLTVEEPGGAARTVMPPILHLGDLAGTDPRRPFDIVFVAVKSYDTVWAVELARLYAAPRAAFVSLQNAWNEPAMAGVVGAGDTFGCAIQSLACDLVAPGRVVRMSPTGSVAVGAFAGPGDPRAARIAEILSAAETSSVTQNLPGIRWSKLVINAMRNGLSAMTGMTGGERDAHPVTRALGIRLGGQAVRVGRAMGLAPPDTAFCFDDLVAAEAGDVEAEARVAARMAEIAAARASEQRPSMAQDIRKGRRTETGAINGYVAQMGDELGIDCTAHARVHETILRIERGELTPSPELADGIA